MQLLQHDLQLLRDRQAKVTGVLQKAHALVGEVEENDCCAEHRACCDHIDVDDVRDAYQHEDDDLAALCELYIYANYLNLNILISCNLR